MKTALHPAPPPVGYGVSGYRTLSPSAKAMVKTTRTSPFVTLGANVIHQGTRNLRQSFAHGFKRHRIIRLRFTIREKLVVDEVFQSVFSTLHSKSRLPK